MFNISTEFLKKSQIRHNMPKNQLVEQHLKHSVIQFQSLKKDDVIQSHKLMRTCIHSVVKNDVQSKIKT
jgi:hypothetical protein